MNQEFGQYQVMAEIGRGGMGVIYKARDPRLDRLVAIKQLVLDSVDISKRDEFRERFRREAILAAAMNHPNLVSIYDVSISELNSYYVMELLEGQSLREELERRVDHKLTAEEFFPIFRNVCAGLAHAHDMGMVHRDVKPDNIFVMNSGKSKITDFGIARSSEVDSANLTKPGVMLGTLSYVSPEQLQDARTVDQHADIYSLAVVAYEVLCGQVPFTGDGLTSTMMAIMSKEARPLNEVNPEINADIMAVVSKAMRKKAAERYSSVTEFEREMERALSLGRQAPRESMLKSGLTGSAPTTSYTPGIPFTKPGLPIESGQRTQGTEEPNKASVKPWLAGRNSENKTIVSVPVVQAAQQQQPSAPVRVVGEFGKQGEDKGCFMEPGAIAVRGGRIIVADSAFRRFQIFGREGSFIGESKTNPGAKSSGTMGGAFSKPSALSLDIRGRIFASDSSDQFIRIYDMNGMYIKEFQNRYGKQGGILGLCFDTYGNLYFSDPDSGCVHVVQSETGIWSRKVGSKGTSEGQLQLPQSVAIDSVGQLFVVDYGTSKINVFSKVGAFVRAFGGKGSGNGEFNVPRGIAIDKLDRLYVSDSLNHRVQVFSSGGYFLYSFGGRGPESGRFVGPADLAIDPDTNYLYVVDRGNCRVQIFELPTT